MTAPTPSAMTPKDPVGASRRGLLVAMAGIAALGGAGLAWRTYRPQTDLPAAEFQFWQMEFATPQGRRLHMSTFRGKPLLVNFWATWCPPCVEELPLLNSFYQENSAKGWQVLALAIDQLESVKHFLANSALAFPVAMAAMPGIEISKSLGNLSGGLPFTVVLGSDGLVAHRKMGKVSPADLRAWTALK